MPTSRAAEVLEELAREQPRRTLFRRDPTGPDDPVPGSSRSLRPLAVLAGAACAVALCVALVLDRRPAPIEERLPMADAHPPTDAATADPAPTTSPTSPSSGAQGTAVGEELVVHLAGAVAAPGVVELPAGSRVVDAVRAAGGLLADADPDRVNLAAPLGDGQRVVIPAVGQEVPAEVVPTGPAGAAPTDGSAGGPPGGDTRIDLNAASSQELETLPGIGPATAAAIISHREREGPFRSVDSLIDVRGIGEAKLDAVRDLVTVGLSR